MLLSNNIVKFINPKKFKTNSKLKKLISKINS